MSRMSGTKGKITEPDPVYNSRLVTLLVNRVSLSGKKRLAQKIVYEALADILAKTEQDPVLVLEKAVKNVKPAVRIKSKRVRGSRYQIPIKIRPYRGISTSLKWMIEFARERSGKHMSAKLASEIMDASKETGNSIRREDQIHKTARSNKAFAHFKY